MVSSSKTKPCQFSSVTSLCARVNGTIDHDFKLERACTFLTSRCPNVSKRYGHVRGACDVICLQEQSWSLTRRRLFQRSSVLQTQSQLVSQHHHHQQQQQQQHHLVVLNTGDDTTANFNFVNFVGLISVRSKEIFFTSNKFYGGGSFSGRLREMGVTNAAKRRKICAC